MLKVKKLKTMIKIKLNLKLNLNLKFKLKLNLKFKLKLNRMFKLSYLNFKLKLKLKFYPKIRIDMVMVPMIDLLTNLVNIILFFLSPFPSF